MIAKNKKLHEALEDMRNGTNDLTDNGKCVQCGACCSNFLPMSSFEIKRIKNYIKTHQVKEFRYLLPLSKMAVNFTCPFMDDSKNKEKCRIYPVRPEICRQFICSPDNRKPFVFKDNDYRLIDVRNEFFNDAEV